MVVLSVHYVYGVKNLLTAATGVFSVGSHYAVRRSALRRCEVKPAPPPPNLRFGAAPVAACAVGIPVTTAALEVVQGAGFEPASPPARQAREASFPEYWVAPPCDSTSRPGVGSALMCAISGTYGISQMPRRLPGCRRHFAGTAGLYPLTFDGMQRFRIVPRFSPECGHVSPSSGKRMNSGRVSLTAALQSQSARRRR